MSDSIPTICITSVGVRSHYVRYLARLEESLQKYAPNIPRLFFKEVWPPDSPSHMESHYSFKAYAMQAVKTAGCDIGIWLDSACEVIGGLGPLLMDIQRDGYYIVADKKHHEPLGEWISDQALEYFNTTRDEAMKLSLCGGAIVGLDFRKPVGNSFLSEWLELAKTDLFFTSHSELSPNRMTSLMVSDGPVRKIVSKDPRFKGHRSDEACFSLMLKKRGLEPQDINQWFTHAEHFNPQAIIKTGYDIKPPKEFSETVSCGLCGARTRGRFQSNGSPKHACGHCIVKLDGYR